MGDAPVDFSYVVDSLTTMDDTTMIDLTTTIVDGLTLRDPFMIASSHWTSTENAYRQLATLTPSAVTLKTTSVTRGGDGTEAVGRERVMHYLVDSFGGRFARYADGPPTVEFWDLSTTFRMTTTAREHLRHTILGLSVLQGEPYSEIARALDLSSYGYVELNLKYTFRDLSFDALGPAIDALLADVGSFCTAFAPLPVLIKIPREALRLWPLPDVQRAYSTLSADGRGLIIANSLKTRVPASRVDTRQPAELTTGIIVGEQLFLDTFDSIRRMATIMPTVPIVASGGIIDIGAVVDVLAAGARAVQLCTALDVRGLQVVDWMRDQLRRLCTDQNLEQLCHALRSDQNRWSATIAASRRLEIQDARRVDVALTEEVLRDPLTEALRIESTGVPVAAEQRSGLHDTYKLVLTDGNVSAFLVARRVRRQLGLTAINCHTTRVFAANLSKPDFRYDFAILPRSVLSYLQRQDARGWDSNVPEEVGVVANSRVELVGDTGAALADIRCVYHFNGASARRAFGELVRDIKPTEVGLIPANLQPIFKLWRRDSGILAKPPLSRLYRLLCEEEVASRWGPIWSAEEPLVLVASRATRTTSRGSDDAACLLEHLRHEVASISRDPAGSASDLIDFGFLDYSKRLLLGTGRR